jgi:hypothetical protein
MGIEEVLIAHRSPWQNPYVERLIGTIRRECLDHLIVINEKHLKRTLGSYLRYYQGWRTHRSLEMDCPEPREVRAVDRGGVVEVPEVGGLHHHYERVAA